MRRISRMVLLSGLVAVVPGSAFAHCDAVDGPVVKAARVAFDSRDPTTVLRWVPPDREGEVREAFDRTIRVRALGADAQALADTWFFETLVRIHRESEGAAFDGLKPAGHIDPLVAAVDATLDTGTDAGLLAKVTEHVTSSMRERFLRAREARAHADDSVEAGRRYVAAYVEYMHHVEGLHRAAMGSGAEHGGRAAAAHPPDTMKSR